MQERITQQMVEHKSEKRRNSETDGRKSWSQHGHKNNDVQTPTNNMDAGIIIQNTNKQHGHKKKRQGGIIIQKQHAVGAGGGGREMKTDNRVWWCVVERVCEVVDGNSAGGGGGVAGMGGGEVVHKHNVGDIRCKRESDNRW